jgi:hypothetical protein
MERMMLLSLFIFACTEQPESPEVIEQDILAEFKAQLSGRFTSEAQSLTDTSYYSVQLHACSVDVPELGADVLYIEQALVNNIQSPYRQRFYVLSDLGDDWVRSEIYTLSDEDSFVGLCNEDEISSFPASVATHKEGCHVVLEWDGDVFFGQTESDSCPSTMGGASYATSIVQTTSSQISSWDQGWDDQGNQVWGAIEGAYLFDRKE